MSRDFLPPATSRLLLTSLCDFVEDSVRHYPFPSTDGAFRDVRVFLHGLPEEQESEPYPFVIVRWMDGETASEPDGQTILRDTVMLGIGVYSPKDQRQAGILCAELLDCLRRALWRKRLLAERFELVEPLRSSGVESGRQMHRFHLVTIETVWNYAWPPKALDNPDISAMCGGRARVLP